MKSSPPTRSVLLTPPGSGAIAVVRVVGARADEIISKAFTPTERKHSLGQAGRITYGTLNRGEEVIDDVLVCRIAGDPVPVWEVCSHGGVRVVQRIIEALSALGACLDMTAGSRAEAAPKRSAIEHDVLSALARVKTVAGLRFLAWQRAHLEEALHALAKRWTTDPDGVWAELRHMIARARQARLLLSGADVAIIGPPNAGKSTLLNRLVGRAAAVVSSTPGTTRDWVDAEIEAKGVPLRLIDTAGRRPSGASVEREAIRRGVAATRTVDLSLIVLDATCVPDEAGMAELCATIPPARAIVVLNKMDLVPEVAKHAGQGGVPLQSTVGQGVAPLQGPPKRTLQRSVRLPDASADPDGRGTLRPTAKQATGHATEHRPALRGWANASGAVSVSISAKVGWGVNGLLDAMLGALGVDGTLVEVPGFFCDRHAAIALPCLDGADPHGCDGAEVIRRLLLGA